MCNADYLADLIAERTELISVMRDAVGKNVKRIVIRGREVEYNDALKHREYLDREIRRLGQASGPARNRVRLGRA